MGRGNHKNGKHNKGLSMTPKKDIAFESDGLDIEFSQELADTNDLQAQERSKAADARAKRKRK